MSILEVNDVSIRYMTGDFKDIGLKEFVMRKLTRNYHVIEFWADRHITFSLEKGDMLGVIGSNGAGKSTLLKAVSGIMEPTEGQICRKGNVAALLELASGFDGDLTVKENTYLRGAMLGYTRKFMDDTYDSIIEFAELQDFQDRPFKQLSSGMKSRLAFSIASLVEPEILILDEVLSVGDGAFRNKSEAKMRQILTGGTTTILVSHSLGQVRELCNKVLWIHKGEQIAFGKTQIICDMYQQFLDKKITVNQAREKLAMLDKHYDYLIVGAGLFGSVFAYEATKHSRKCLVIDKRPQTGGNVYCEENEGILVHKFGAHVFHTDKKKVWDYINQFAKFNNYIHTVTADYCGERYSMPINMKTFEQIWGVKTPEEAKAIIAGQRGKYIGEPKNLEEQAISMVGRDIYEKLIKGYTEKQWGRECRLLPASIIKRLPLRFVYDDRYFDDLYQGIPVGGYNGIIEKLLKGSEVLTDMSYNEFRESYPDIADKILFTGAIDEYFGYSLGRLEYRGLNFKQESLLVDDYQGCAVVNFTDTETPYTRIIEHKHFEPSSETSNHTVTVITREYPQEWMPGQEPYYPVNDEKNSALYAKYRALANKEGNVIFGGRLGNYKYYDMDDVIDAALNAVNKEFDEKSPY